MKRLRQLLKSELRKMCSDSVGSILQEKSNEALSVFQWKSLVKELKDNAPLLFDLMWGCTTTKKPRMNREATIGICAAILLNFRYPKMNLAQKIISLVLYCGNSAKQVQLVNSFNF